ncbi:MAG: type II toxin-antitoxin system RelE/ParE family toxin [Nitrospirota bacterium]
MKIAVKPSARKELIDLPDHILVKAFKTILDLGENPRPRGYDKVEGRPGVLRVWIDRDYRVLYEIDTTEDKLRIIAVGIKSKHTYK